MVKICIVSYYELKEALLLAAEELKLLNHDVINYPLFKYKNDVNDKRDDYLDHMINYVNQEQVDVVLWWYIGISSFEFITIKEQTQKPFIFFNWDEPYNWGQCDLAGKAPYFDAVFVTCKETLSKYVSLGTKNAYYLLPGFSPDVHKPQEYSEDDEKKYSCDISFVLTNLYSNLSEFPDQYIQRKKLLDDIYNYRKDGQYNLHIYGPDFLKEMYPDSYKGYCYYQDTPKVFHYSKINLCTHCMCNMDGYINERVIAVGGTGGLLLVDKVKGIENMFDPKKDIIVLDKDYYIKQIKYILTHYDIFYQRRKNLRNRCLDNYTYTHWAQFINDNYLSKLPLN